MVTVRQILGATAVLGSLGLIPEKTVGEDTATPWGTGLLGCGPLCGRRPKDATLVLAEMTVEAQWVLGGEGKWIGAAYWEQGCVLR